MGGTNQGAAMLNRQALECNYQSSHYRKAQKLAGVRRRENGKRNGEHI